MFSIVALVLGIVRWPWWTLVVLLAARVAWVIYVDLPGLNALRPPGEPAVGLESEAAMIGLVLSLAQIAAAYVAGRGARAFFEWTRRPS
ncbi:hypothetical protein PRN20_12280 [Devosia sp. ZB163]|uniref:hypothetical protein n=1 Tax=Devosia sp. ZB163 TaxID=3025938 RepID=UPI0023620261|nr:hypothetical protein [Devosia sp. ZB163]MDC9824512.1 hypothetical protein [Devosia sp. ZB163]